jgi:phytoene dehydrogenase-like protein
MGGVFDTRCEDATVRYDAVVIGSGPNGLVAAITLARAGRSVLVVEAAPALGGALQTAELTLAGFHHDVFSAVHPAALASPVLEALELERYGLRWIHPQLAMAHPLPDGRAAVLSRSLQRTRASLDALAPGDGARWQALVEPYLRRWDAMRATMLSGFPPLRGPLRLAAGVKLSGTLELARLVLMPADALAAEVFRGEGAAWLYGSALHADAPLDGGGSAIAGFWLALMGHAVGWPSAAGGAGRVADALVACLRAHGGEARPAAAAARVHARRGRVGTVQLAGGETVATRIVVATTTPGELVRLAGDALGDGYVRRALRFRPGPQTIKLDWALDAPIPWSSEDTRRAGTVHVGGTVAQLRASRHEVACGRLPEQPFLLCGQQTVADPSRAPAGKHTAWAYSHTPPGVDWSREREPFADTIERWIERFAPGFRERILARHILAPGDLERRNRNLVGGDVGGGSYALDQLVFRPMASLRPYATPLRGLYIGSASAFPGAAVHGVPGHAAARAAIRGDRLRVRGRGGSR